MKIKDITSQWFFTEVTFPLRFLLIFIKGDAMILIPFVLLLLLVGFFSIKWMLLLFGLYFAFRFLGEMIYWLLQQFGNRTYRPYDFGLKKLDNNALYIMYQVCSLIGLVISTAFIFLIASSR
ncbi:hypothetical protein KBC80_05800 [Candidatus Woesebacteria bacterium]|nr:hypothetical protein [Candidatus Woesebacteria bacterium]